jgi:hypothetical protein
VRILQAGTSYFALVFGAGFLLGALRVALMVPRLGERLAELLEMPAMFVVILVSARFVTMRFALPATASVRLATGVIALGMMIAAELLFVALLQGRSLGAYIASRDPVSGGAYLALLALFALMPLILARVASRSAA